MDEAFSRLPSRRRSISLALNILTVLVLLATLCVGGAFAAILVNPYVSFNPYPPPTQVATLGLPTATDTPAITLPPEFTATATRTPGPFLPPTATQTPPLPPSPTLDETQAARATELEGPPFAVQGDSVFIPNDLGCEWMGVGGQVFNQEGSPIIGLSVHLEGTLEGESVTLDTLSGSAANLGPSGYVFSLADRPIASEGDLWVQLNDTAGLPLSDQFFVSTSDSCDENFVLVNWRQVR